MSAKTVRLFDKDSYLRTFHARVLSCIKKEDNYLIILDQTLFFPEEGGQGADTGWLEDLPVLDVQISDGIIEHTLPAPIHEGTSICGELAWEGRYSNMQQHSGEHIMSGLIHKLFGYDNVGFHLGTQAVTLDFNGYLEPEELTKIETMANQAIYHNVGITAAYPPPKLLSSMEYRSKLALTREVRIVTIPGYDVCACCAPHVRSTGEIGIIKIVDSTRYKAGIRISILCGSRALEDYKDKQRQVTDISVLLSARQDGVSDAVLRLKNELFESKGEHLKLQDELVRLKTGMTPETPGDLCIFTAAQDPQTQRKYVNLLLPKCGGICAVFSKASDSGYHYMIASSTRDVRLVSKELSTKFGAKGGGSRAMVQGSVTAGEAQLRSLFQ